MKYLLKLRLQVLSTFLFFIFFTIQQRTVAQTVSIPDANFEQSLIDLGFDTNGLNGNILISDAEAVTDLNLTNPLFDPVFGNPGITTVTQKIADLTGIEAFINLTNLGCSFSDLITVDLSNNVNLVDLFLNDNLLTGIDISANTLLTRFGVMRNQINTINVSSNTLLEELFLDDTGISSIDVSNNLNLWKLFIYDNPSLTSLDLSNNTGLTQIRVQNNTSLSSLDIRNGNNVNITGLFITNTPLLTCINTDAIVSEPMITYRGDKIYSTDCSNTTTIAIPDTNFEQALIDLGFDTNGLNGNILETNALAITELYIDDPVNNANLPNVNAAISDLTGMESFTNLSLLHCRFNQLLDLDVTNNTALTELECEGNQLTELNVTQNTLLHTLGFGPNNISTIDVSQNLALEKFWSNGNNLSTLNLDANTSLNVCGLSDNPLTSVSLKNGNNQNMIYFVADNTPNLTCINTDAITSQTMIDSGKVLSTDCGNTNTIAIPDANFEQALIDLGFDTNGLNGNILETNALAVTQLYISDPLNNANLPNVNATISDLTGLEGFTNLERFAANENSITSIDITQNTALEWLFLRNNQLSSIDISNNLALTRFSLEGNTISSIDVSSHTALTELYLGSNNISSIDVTNNINLDRFYINDNQITSIDVSNNTLLTRLWLHNNQISTIDVTNNIALELLYLEGNLLTSVNVSQNINLFNLAVGYNSITSLDVTNLTAIQALTTEGTLISSLDLSQNIILEQLWIADNPNLTSIDVSNNPLLFNLGIYNTSIASLDLSSNAIETLYAGNNASLSFMDFRNGNNINVTVFDVSNNPLLTCINTDATTSQVMIDSGISLSTDCGIVPSIERDALIALYNSADGPNWTDNTNWNTTQPVSTWTGVTVVNGHVTSINRFNSNLTGTLPAELQDLTYLEYLHVGRNNLSGTIPDLTGLANLNLMNININYFQFGDFENEFASYNTNIDNFGYAFMSKVENEIDIDLVVGDDYVLTMPVINGTGVTYQWYKNNEPLVGETGLTFTITNAQEADAGNYTCKASSPIITDLVIERETVHIYRDILASDRDALIAIYNATNGASWTTNTNWNTAAPVYQWHGVTVSDNRVIEINLESNNLVGTLPAQLGDLGSLEKLVLNFNNLTGAIPVEIGNCTSLTEINFWGNNLSGNIPSELGNCSSLRTLSLEDNQLTGNIPTSFSNLTAMGSFWVNGNQLSGDIPDIFSYWPELFYFSIGDVNGSGSYNNFTGTVDLSNNPDLIGCWIDNNAISALNLKNGNNVNFNSNNFNANNNPNLVCIQVDDAAYSTTNWTSIDPTASFNEDCGNPTSIAIPDANFEQALIDLGFDTNGLNGNILETDAFAVTLLDISDPINNTNLPNVNANITDLTGIEAFVNLLEFNASKNDISGVDLSNNTLLTSLIIQDCLNITTTIDVSNNVDLVTLDLGRNRISGTVVLNNLINLEYLYLQSNQNITSLDLANNPNLKVVWASWNQISNVNVSGNLDLQELWVHNNTINTIDVTNNGSLEVLSVRNNGMNTLNITNNPLLYRLDCNGNNLATIDLSNNSLLETLYAHDNQITTLNLNSNTLLTNLQVHNNQISTIDVTNNTALVTLFLENNLLTSVDVSQNVNLYNLAVGLNPITSLDITMLPQLPILTTEGTLINELDLSNNVNLEQLWIADNPNLTDINLSNNPLLFNLGTYNTPLESLDLSNNAITSLYAYDMPNLYRLDLNNGNNTNVTEMHLTNNPSLECISVDDATYATSNWTNIDGTAAFSEDCNAVWTVYTTDPNLDTAIDAYLVVIDTDMDGVMSYEEASNFTGNLDFSNSSIEDIVGLEAFTSVVEINLSGNSITDLSGLIDSDAIILTRNGIEFKTVERRNFSALQVLNCSNNNLTHLDVSIITTLTTLDCSNNQLEVLNVKNGNNSLLTSFDATNNPGLYCVLVDDVAYSVTNWIAKDNQTLFSDTDCHAKLQPKVFLQGAMLNPIFGEEHLMRDNLRSLGYLPTTSPYADALTCDVSVFNITGNDAIVDWIEISLRDALSPGNKLQTRSALLQRDGDVVDVDGVSEIAFDLWAKPYYVSINHRNHLGVMSNGSSILNFTPSAFNFSDGSISTYGSNAQVVLGSGDTALWSGDTNSANQIKFSGANNGSNTIKDFVLADPANGFNSVTFSSTGYLNVDLNMDGNGKFSGSGNDSNIIKDNVLAHPSNGFNSPTFTISPTTP